MGLRRAPAVTPAGAPTTVRRPRLQRSSSGEYGWAPDNQGRSRRSGGDARGQAAGSAPGPDRGWVPDQDADGAWEAGPRSVVAAIGPDAVETFGRMLRVGAGWTTTLIVTGYPAEVGLAWLDAVLRGTVRLDVAVHIEPLPPATAAAGLRKSRARLESTRRLDADRGRLGDPLTDIAAQDAADLADRLARGQTRLFRVGVYLTVHAPTRPALAEAVAQVQAAAASVLLDTRPATWRHLQGWTSTLPLGHDALRMRRVFDTDALALSFPLASPDLPGPLPGESTPAAGVLLGVTDPTGTPGGIGSGAAAATAGGGVVWWDRWSQHNHNSLVLARSGAGKSYLVKLEILRSLYDDVHVAVIDPDDEYAALAAAVGGARIALGAPGVRVNPLDIPAGDRRPDALTRRALFLHTLVTVLLGHALPPAERAALDHAITCTYAAAGISNHPRTWSRPAPLLRDLAASLGRAAGHDPTGEPASTAPGVTASGLTAGVTAAGDMRSAAATLQARLAPWITGSFRALFDGPTTTAARGRLVVWSTRHLPDELRAAGMLLALDAIWRDVDHPCTSTASTTAGSSDPEGVAGWADGPDPSASGDADLYVDRDTGAGNPWVRAAHPDGAGGSRRRRLVVVDEAWTLMREGEGARFLFRLAKAARKRNAGLTVVTQDVADLLGSEVGQAVAANAATQILMRQAPQAIDVVGHAFGLTEGEAHMLLAAGRGHALLVAGSGTRVAFRTVASPREHALATTGLEATTRAPHTGDPATVPSSQPPRTSPSPSLSASASQPAPERQPRRSTGRPPQRRTPGGAR